MGVVGVLLAALILGFLGRLWWVFDLPANYRPHLGFVLLVAAGALWALDRGIARAALVGALVGLSAVLPMYLGSRPHPAAGAATMEIIGFNVGVSNPNRSEVAVFLAEEEPDLVFLFESSFE